jgi:hypothetical protein
MRLVYESKEYSDVSDPTLTVNIQIPTADYEGWLVTLLKNGVTQMVHPGTRIVFDIDNKAAWDRITNAVSQATSTVSTSQFIFDVKNLFTVFSPPTPASGSATTGTRLEEKLLLKNRHNSVGVRILLNEMKMIPGADVLANRLAASCVAVKDYYEKEKAKQNHTVEVRTLKTEYSSALADCKGADSIPGHEVRARELDTVRPGASRGGQSRGATAARGDAAHPERRSAPSQEGAPPDRPAARRPNVNLDLKEDSAVRK